MATEFERIALIHAILGAPPSDVSLGIGDDAAIVSLRDKSRDLVWTVDSFVENIHFRQDLMSWRDVGWRSLMTAASDLAAMASAPVGVLAAIVLPSGFRDDDLLEIARGQAEASRLIGTSVVGGNLSRGSEVSIATTVLGSVARPVRRDSARPGHALIACGEIGLANAGLRLLLDDPRRSLADPDVVDAVRSYRRPVARIDDGLRCAGLASSLIDVSDGLAQDVGHIAEASGVRMELDLDAIVDARLRRLADAIGVDASELALHGGDDYALVGTAPMNAVPSGFRVIGRCMEGEGVWIAGTQQRVRARGHDHFRA